MNRNYQNELDELLITLGTQRPRLLLHACCAPCASYVLRYLIEQFDITLLYYNPNIRPLEEYERRLFWLRRLLECMDLPKRVPLPVPDYETELFSSAAAGLEMEREGAGRCAACFQLRLGRTAALAAREGFDFFLHYPDRFAH